MTRSIDIHIGKRLKFLRQQRGLSRSDLEVAAKIEKGSVEKFERGTSNIKANEIFQISAVLMTTIGFFYADSSLKHEKTASKKLTRVKFGEERDKRA